MATRYVEIKKDNFDACKSNPKVVHTWEIWKERDSIVCRSLSGAQGGKEIYRFPLRTGTIGLFNNSSKKYAYFRAPEFANLLKELGIDKVIKQDPNRNYFGRNARHGCGDSSFSVITDGETILSYDIGQSSEWQEQYPGTVAWEENQEIKVSSATWAVVLTRNYEHDRRSYCKALWTLRPLDENLKQEVLGGGNG